MKRTKAKPSNEPSDPRLKRLKRALDARNNAVDHLIAAREELLAAELEFSATTRQLFLLAAKLQPKYANDNRLSVILRACLGDMRRQEQ